MSLALTMPMWITVNVLGAPDNGVIFASYMGAWLMAGAFLATTTDDSGVLFSAGDFTVGDKLVSDGDVLTVTYQFSLAAA